VAESFNWKNQSYEGSAKKAIEHTYQQSSQGKGSSRAHRYLDPRTKIIKNELDRSKEWWGLMN